MLTGSKRSRVPSDDTTPPPPPQRRALECPICMDRPVNSTLPCMHRFCNACLTRYAELAREGGRPSKCPLCRRNFTLYETDRESPAIPTVPIPTVPAPTAPAPTVPAPTGPAVSGDYPYYQRKPGYNHRGNPYATKHMLQSTLNVMLTRMISIVDKGLAHRLIAPQSAPGWVGVDVARGILRYFPSVMRIDVFKSLYIYGKVDCMHDLFQTDEDKIAFYAFIDKYYKKLDGHQLTQTKLYYGRQTVLPPPPPPVVLPRNWEMYCV